MMVAADGQAMGSGGTAYRMDRGQCGRVAVFTGSTPNIGTTVAAFGTAVQLASITGERVAYLCLNLKSSKLHRYLGREECRLGLDQIRAEMRSGSLNPGLLASCLEPLKNRADVQILFGTMQREQAEFFQPEDIRHLLDAVRSVYKLCVVDVNAYWDNAATVTSLLEADQRIMVTTPDLGHFQEDLLRTAKTLGPLVGVPPASFLLAVSQYNSRDNGGIKKADIERETGMKLACAVPWDLSLRDCLNQGRLEDYVCHNKAFIQSLSPLCLTLADAFDASLPTKPPAFRVKGWRPLFSGK